MQENNILISLCIPTNGVLEWVIPVLNSIYSQNVDEKLFEVIVSDNGTNSSFEKEMITYSAEHSNLHYIKSNEQLFMNEIEAYRHACGTLIKFVNHRTVLLPGSIEKWITFVKENKNDKPITYFANGAIEKVHGIVECKSFDNFLRTLSIWSSWSTGLCFWNDDFPIINSMQIDSELFPHTAILFSITENRKYIVDNEKWADELPIKNISKGKYDFFYAFCVEYPLLLTELCKKSKISENTLKILLKRDKRFVGGYYWKYYILKKACSYDMSGVKRWCGIFLKEKDIFLSGILESINYFFQEFTRRVK